MKRLIYLSLIVFISLSSAKAQKPITLNEDSVKFGNRFFPGFWLSIPEVKSADVKAAWIKTIEKGTKSKVTTERDEMTLFGAIIPDFTKGSVNIMSKIADKDTLTRLFVSVETTRDNFVGNTSEEYDKMSAFLKKFGKGQYVELAKDQLSAEELKLKDLEKELKTARKDKEKFDKGIQSSEVEIAEQNDNIKRMNMELETTDGKIDNASSALSAMDEGEAKKTKNSELKDLQKKKKGLLKDINSAQNRIAKEKTSIEDNKNNIERNAVTQQELSDKITEQKGVIARYQQKLKTIEAY